MLEEALEIIESETAMQSASPESKIISKVT